MNDDASKKSWFSRLKSGLSKTSTGISGGITDIFTKRRLDDEMLEELEELLITSDMGAGVAAKIVAAFSKGRFDKEIAPDEVKEALAGEIAALLAPVAHPLVIDPTHRPYVVMVVGVNGNGKTTTMGKLAYQLSREEEEARPGGAPSASQETGEGRNYKTMLAAADTFRAAAVEQLKVWGERAQVPVVSGEEGADPASVAYRALEQATAQGAEVVMIDTAGRLHNKKNLMEELQKIVRVLKKIDESAPHKVLLVLDGTTGQNALAQVAAFQELIAVNGLVITKLDGTAKGGVVVALAEKFKLPIHAIGVGEGLEDLRPFTAEDFARSLVGL